MAKIETQAPAVFDESRFEVTRDVTLPLLKIKVGESYFVTLLAPMFLGKEIAAKATVDAATGEVKSVARQPAYLVHALNLKTGGKVQFICSTVLRKQLDEEYPDQSYVGKSFRFSIEKIDGKNYNVPQIAEIQAK